jgi:hypothetical protein
VGNFVAKNKDFMKTIDPTGKLYAMVSSIEDEINAQKAQTGAAGVTQTGQGAPSPKPPTAIDVQAAGGIFQVNVTDAQPGVNYVLEYSTTKGFTATPRQIALPLGVKSYRGFLGNQTLYWGVKAGNQTAPHAAPLSDRTYFGTSAEPTPVIGGGSTIGPPA